MLSLLFGKFDNKEFNKAFCDYCLNIGSIANKHEWLQVYPKKWNDILGSILKSHLITSNESKKTHSKIIEVQTRVNFLFNPKKYLSLKQNLPKSNFGVSHTDKRVFQEMKGSIIPSKFWKYPDDFLEISIGFSAFYNGKVAPTTFAAFIHDNKLGIGLETIEKCRGMGFALQTCLAMIDFCLDNDFHPIWACRLENIGSFKLAQKLGFEPISKISFYKLCIEQLVLIY